jgi:hypothetical protein
MWAARISKCATSAMERSVTTLPRLLGDRVRTQLPRPRKGKGDGSMLGQGAGWGKATGAPPRQRKARMVKARLLEPQSSRLYAWQRPTVAERPFWEVADVILLRPRPSLPSVPSIGGIKGTNREPPRAASLLHRKCGIACAGDTASSLHLYGNGVSVLPRGPVMGTADGPRAIPTRV